MRRKNKVRYSVIITILFILAVGAGVYLFLSVKNINEEKTQLSTFIENNSQTVYVATRYIKRGETLIADGPNKNVELQNIATGLELYNFITAANLGNTAIVDISQGLPIMNNMITLEEIQMDSREYEISAAHLMTDLQEFDYVDIRIAFPNGEDYVVISKAEVKNLYLSECVFTTTLTELEILRLHSAILDAYTITGTRLYVTRYVESSLQDAAAVTYPVKLPTAQISISDSNVSSAELQTAIETLNTEARLEMEMRLESLDVGVSEDVDSNISEEESRYDGITGTNGEE